MFFKKYTSKVVNLSIDDYEVEVSFKPIKNLYLRVSRRTGEIRVSAPHHTDNITLQRFVQSRSKWIDKHLANLLPQERELKYEKDELVSFLGSQLPLKIDYTNKNINAYSHNDYLLLRIKADYTIEQKEKVLDTLYRQKLKDIVKKLIRKWEPVMGVEVRDFGIRKMKTRWGTCNIRDQRIWLNLHLAKENPDVIEMVVVHEMVHLLERLHSKRFYNFMDQFLPDWKERSNELDGRVC